MVLSSTSAADCADTAAAVSRTDYQERLLALTCTLESRDAALASAARHHQDELSAAEQQSSSLFKRLADMEKVHTADQECITAIREKLDELKGVLQAQPEICQLLEQSLRNGGWSGKGVLLAYLKDVVRKTAAGGSVQYSEETWAAAMMMYNTGHSGAVDFFAKNFGGPSLESVQRKMRSASSQIEIPREMNATSFAAAKAFYQINYDTDLTTERCMVIFDATALLPFCTFFSDGTPGGLVDWSLHPNPCTNGDEIAAIFKGVDGKEPPEHAKQVMAFVIVVLSQPHLPAFVVAAQEHRSSDKGEVAKWETQAFSAAEASGIKNFAGFCCDGDSSPRSYCSDRFTTKAGSIPKNCVGIRRDCRFDSFFGRYESFDRGSSKALVAFRSDIVHITKKQRNQLLSMVSKTLVIGPFHVTLQHIKEMMLSMEEAGEQHGISKSAYDVVDKQNVRAANELLKRRDIPKLLLKYVGSKAKGTALYFEYSSLLVMAYFDKSMSAKERMTSAMKAVFFFDYWDQWLRREGSVYKRKSSFISDQSYKDLTIAAYALIIDYASNCLDNRYQHFLPCNHNSDKIEHLFGQIRELIPGQRDVNFVEFIQRCKRIQVSMGVSHQKSSDGSAMFVEKVTDNRQKISDQEPANVEEKPRNKAELKIMMNTCIKEAEAQVWKDLETSIDCSGLDRDTGTAFVYGPVAASEQGTESNSNNGDYSNQGDNDDDDDDDDGFDLDAMLAEAISIGGGEEAEEAAETVAAVLEREMGNQEDVAFGVALVDASSFHRIPFSPPVAPTPVDGGVDQGAARRIALSPSTSFLSPTTRPAALPGVTGADTSELVSLFDSPTPAAQSNHVIATTTSQRAQMVSHGGLTFKSRLSMASYMQGRMHKKPMDRKARFWMISSDSWMPVSAVEASTLALAPGKWVFVWVEALKRIGFGLISHITYSPTTKSAFLRDKWEVGDSPNTEIVLTLADLESGACDSTTEEEATAEVYGFYSCNKRRVMKFMVGNVVSLIPEDCVTMFEGKVELSSSSVYLRNSKAEVVRLEAEKEAQRVLAEKDAQAAAARVTRASDANKMHVEELKEELEKAIGAVPTRPMQSKLAAVVANLRGGRLHEVTMIRDIGGEKRRSGVLLEQLDRVEVAVNSPLAGGFRITAFEQHTPADRASKVGLLKAGDIVLQVDGKPVLKQQTKKFKSSSILFDKDGTSITLLVFSESQEEREENAAVMQQLLEQDKISRSDVSYANAKHKRNKSASRRVPQIAASYIGCIFSDAEEGPGVLWQIEDVYFSEAEGEIALDFRKYNSDNSEENDIQIALFRDFLTWDGLEFHEPATGAHGSDELSPYEQIRKARIEANRNMLIELGLA